MIDIGKSVALCKIFAITNLTLYVATSSVINLVIAMLMLGYVILAQQMKD
jgi:hypothetical protein